MENRTRTIRPIRNPVLTRDYEANHQKFRGKKIASDEAVAVWAAFARESGLEPVIMQSTLAEQRADWQDHSDKGDIYLNGLRVEIKQLGRNFTGPDDWPFGKKFMVCSQHSFDRAEAAGIRPYIYYIFSNDYSTIGMVRVDETRDQWWVENKYDTEYGQYQDFYMTWVSTVQFIPLPPHHKPQPKKLAA